MREYSAQMTRFCVHDKSSAGDLIESGAGIPWQTAIAVSYPDVPPHIRQISARERQESVLWENQLRACSSTLGFDSVRAALRPGAGNAPLYGHQPIFMSTMASKLVQAGNTVRNLLSLLQVRRSSLRLETRMLARSSGPALLYGRSSAL